MAINYFYFEAVSGNTTVTWGSSGNFMYSTDAENWTALGTSGVLVPNNTRLYLKGNNNQVGTVNQRHFVVNGYFKLGGDIRSLVNTEASGDTIPSTHCFSGVFKNCTGLTEVSEELLSGYTTLGERCYLDMFLKCTRLTNAPALPATTMGYRSYEGMFDGCTSLTTAPALPATTLNTGCYDRMFKGCTSLVNPPTLPATTLDGACYYHMFENCTSLVVMPDLPATTLDYDCYAGMFQGCTSLSVVPSVLPATTLEDECYISMFSGCTSLTTAPALPATTLVDACYARMFQGCTNLRYIECMALSIPSTGCTSNWVAGVQTVSGTFSKNPSMNTWTRGTSGIPSNWDVEGYDPSYTGETGQTVYYFYFEAREDNSALFCGGNLPVQGAIMQYSYDGYNWTTFTNRNATANRGERIYLKGNYPYFCDPTRTYYRDHFSTPSGSFDIGGDIRSLVTRNSTPTTFLYDREFYGVFEGCNIVNAGDIFKGFSTETTRTTHTLERMFVNCTILETAPELPFKEVTESAYQNMFSGCTKLNYIKCLATDISASASTTNWVAGVQTDGGTFVKDKNMNSWTIGVNGIPVNWNVTTPSYTGYTNYIVFTPLQSGTTVTLTKVGSPTQTAPQLVYSTDGEIWYDWDGTISLGEDKLYVCAKDSNAGFGDPNDGSKYYKFTTTGTFDLGGDIRALINRDASGTTVPANRCFVALFEGTGVVNVDQNFLSGYTTITNRCYARMFESCASLVSAPALPATTMQDSCYLGMFKGDTSLTTAPTLPATTLVNGCYNTMFAECSALTSIECYAVAQETSGSTENWARNVQTNSGTFTKANSMSNWGTGNNGIPTNWAVEDMLKIQFRKNGQTTWVDSYPVYLPIEASGGSVIYEVKYTFGTLNYTTGHNQVPTGWSIVDGWSTQGSGYKVQQYTINYPPSTGSTPESALVSFFLSDNGETISNSIPLSASTLYTSYLYVGDESGSTTTTMEASWEGEHDSDFHTYYWEENIDHFTLSADVDWITDIWTDGEDEEIGCYVEPNYGLAPRTGTITVVGTDTIGRTHTCTIVINQEWYVRYPIWQDVYFTGATDTLDYYILMDTGAASREIIYQGRAYLQPNQSHVKINISKICQNYLSNNIEDGNSIRNLDNVNVNTMKVFAIFNASGDTQLKAYTYVYDWSYSNLSEDGILTKPINGHADSRMVKLGTSVETSLYYRNHPIPSIYTSGYCGDYAIYYLQRNGGWAAFLIEGNAKKTDRYEKYSYNMAFDNNKAMFEESTYHNQITAEWQLSTGWLTDEQAENLAFNLIPSNRVFLHDLKNDKIIPVIVSNDSIDYKTFKNTGRQMVRYDITLTESQKKQML